MIRISALLGQKYLDFLQKARDSVGLWHRLVKPLAQGRGLLLSHSTPALLRTAHVGVGGGITTSRTGLKCEEGKVVLRPPRLCVGVFCLPLEATRLPWAYLPLPLNKWLRICQWQSGELGQLLIHSLTHSFGDIFWVSSNVPGTMLHTGDKVVTKIPSLSSKGFTV